ncbi:MAG: PH domain-containing protein [Kangiellaceae bacterium]|nr:PH domain-containing protein [Kangiellaceae bacterium]
MYYKASLGTSARWITFLTTLLLISIPLIILANAGTAEQPAIVFSLLLPVLIPLICFVYRVTGYELDSKQILVKRLVGDFSVPLNEIDSIEVNPNAMKRSFRTFGNGGLFGFYGRFRNSVYGPYRAFVTDPNNSIVLKQQNAVIILSPDEPQKFAKKLAEKLSKQNN